MIGYRELDLRPDGRPLIVVATIWLGVGVLVHLLTFFSLFLLSPGAASFLEVIPRTLPFFAATLMVMCIPFALHTLGPGRSLIWSRLIFALSVVLISFGIAAITREGVPGRVQGMTSFWLFWIAIAGGVTALTFAAVALQLKSYRSRTRAIIEISTIAAMPTLSLLTVPVVLALR